MVVLTGRVVIFTAQVHFAAFQEYFTGNGCCNQPLSAAGLFGPTFTLADGVTQVQPSAIMPDYMTPEATKCRLSNVDKCIPGWGCGSSAKPQVYSVAGGSTQRKNPNKVPLW